MATADDSGGSDGFGSVLKLPQLKRLTLAYRCAHIRQPTAIQQAVVPLEDDYVTMEFLIDRSKILTELEHCLKIRTR